MTSVYGKTLYQKRFMMLGWFIGVAAITLLTMSVYNSFSGGSLGDSLQNLPPALQKFAGDAASFKTVGGYISQQVFALRAPLLLIILAIAIMVSVTAGDEERGLTESQLALPISRSSLLLQKLAAAVSIIIIASLGVLVGVQVGVWSIGQSYDIIDILPHLVGCLLVAICYGMIGFTVAAVTGRRALALGAASGLAFLSFLINSMAGAVASLQTLDKLTFFHYYQITGGYAWDNILLLIVIALLLTVVGVIAFSQRDIRAR